MYKLKSTEPYWLELVPGVELFVKPLNTAVMMAVQADLRNLPLDDETEKTYALVNKVAHRVIQDWRGIGDANGEVAVVADHTINALMADFNLFTAFDQKYFAPYFERQAEKNG